eukprot:25974-Eustigmatos_ZCMA.PRE.1
MEHVSVVQGIRGVIEGNTDGFDCEVTCKRARDITRDHLLVERSTIWSMRWHSLLACPLCDTPLVRQQHLHHHAAAEE